MVSVREKICSIKLLDFIKKIKITLNFYDLEVSKVKIASFYELIKEHSTEHSSFDNRLVYFSKDALNIIEEIHNYINENFDSSINKYAFKITATSIESSVLIQPKSMHVIVSVENEIIKDETTLLIIEPMILYSAFIIHIKSITSDAESISNNNKIN